MEKVKKLERLARLITLDAILEEAGETISHEALEAMIGLEAVLDKAIRNYPDVAEVLDTAVDGSELILYLVPFVAADIERLMEQSEKGEELA